MIEAIKARLYFPIASYFRFFAAIRLKRWNPHIVVVTGSSGKTTLLHLLESQFRSHARYSHHANSAFGVSFDILGMHRASLRRSEWFSLFFNAPRMAFAKPPEEKIYIVEADCDRPGEGKFLASLLKPEVVLWLNVSKTHGANFDRLVSQPVISSDQRESRDLNTFPTVDKAIAHEFGYFLEYCTHFAVVNGDIPVLVQQVGRAKANLSLIKKDHYLTHYKIDKTGTVFGVEDTKYAFSALLPESVFYSLVLCRKAVEYFDLPFDPTFTHFVIPEGRTSLFQGKHDTTLIDSTYNANLGSNKAVLDMFAQFPQKKKWVVLGDMLELGKQEQKEHEKLADVLVQHAFTNIILVGPRMRQYVYPKLHKEGSDPEKIIAFERAKDVLFYLKHNLHGGEGVLFKGSQSLLLEGVVEHLLADKKDADRLPRRGKFWEEKRKRVGL